MGEAGRTGTTRSGERHNGFVLNEFLQRESNLSDKHYTMIQVFVSFCLYEGSFSNKAPPTVWAQSTLTPDVRGGRTK
jgi:hypothetical protein